MPEDLSIKDDFTQIELISEVKNESNASENLNQINNTTQNDLCKTKNVLKLSKTSNDYSTNSVSIKNTFVKNIKDSLFLNK